MLWIPLDNLRKALRVEIREDDAELARLVQAAQAYVERRTGVTIGTATKHQYLSAFRDCVIEGFPFGAITSVQYYKAGVLTTLSATDYDIRYVDGPLAMLKFDTTETADEDTVDITYTCGYGNQVPKDLMHAGVSLVAHWFNNVEATAPVDLRPVPYTTGVILDMHRVRSDLR